LAKEEINEEIIWLQRLIAGDEDAFANIYKKFNRSIYHFIVKYVSSSQMAEDLAQEVFIKLWENRENLGNVQSFRSYLFVTARNHTLNAMKTAFRSEAAMGVIVNSFVNTRSTIEEDIIHGEYLEFLNRVLNSLPQRTREIFKMCREQGKNLR